MFFCLDFDHFLIGVALCFVRDALFFTLQISQHTEFIHTLMSRHASRLWQHSRKQVQVEQVG